MGTAAAAAPSSQHRETYSKLFLGDFRRDVPAPGNAYFGLRSSFRAMVFPRPGGSCLCGHSSREQQAAAGSSRQQQAAAGSRQPQAAAGSSRQQQAAAGSSRQQQAAAGTSRQQQTQADASVSATAAVQQLTASQQPETYIASFCRRFQKGRSGPGKRLGRVFVGTAGAAVAVALQ